MKALLRVGLTGIALILESCTPHASPKVSPESRSTAAAAEPPASPALEVKAPDESAEAPATPPEPVSSQVLVGETRLELRGCELAYGSGTESRVIPTQLHPSCQFAKNKDGSIRIVETPNGSVLIVESSRKASEAGRSPIDCDTRLRGIIVTAQGVHLSRDTQRIAHCAPGLWDEKMFQVFALDPAHP